MGSSSREGLVGYEQGSDGNSANIMRGGNRFQTPVLRHPEEILFPGLSFCRSEPAMCQRLWTLCQGRGSEDASSRQSRLGSC